MKYIRIVAIPQRSLPFVH